MMTITVATRRTLGIVCFLGIILLAQSVSGTKLIKCFVCESPNTEKASCADGELDGVPTKNCQTTCAKVITNGTTITRKCTLWKQRDGCEKETDGQIKCFCNLNYCNSASSVTSYLQACLIGALVILKQLL